MSVLRTIENVDQAIEQIANDVSVLAPPPIGTVAGVLALGARAVDIVLREIDAVESDPAALTETEIIAAVRAARVAKARAQLEKEET